MARKMLTDMADVLREAGLDVIELPGWEKRGETDGNYEPIGVLLHHDAMGLGWNTNPNDDLNVPKYMSRNGIVGAPLWVSRFGTWIIGAAGRKWHAGAGEGYNKVPANDGNSYLLGVETDHTVGNPWPKAQVDSIYVGCRALVKHYGWSKNDCGHLEYAPNRKIDPEKFDLDKWRKYLEDGGNIVDEIKPSRPKPKEKAKEYKVKKGDTLWAISRKFDVAVSRIVAENSIKDPDVIKVGQKLTIPGVLKDTSKTTSNYTPPPAAFPSKYKAHREYFGLITGPHSSHGGYYSNERKYVRWIQVRMQELGYAPSYKSWADGIYEKPTFNAVANWQRARHSATTTLYGQVWWDDWRNLERDR